MSKSLPANASLEQLKKQAKDVLHAHDRKDVSACAILRNLNRFKEAPDSAILATELNLHDAQFALAMEYGFKSWVDLKAQVEQPGDEPLLGEMPEHPELDYIRKQVQTVLAAHGGKDPRIVKVLKALDRFKTDSDAHILASTIGLAEAQLAVAVAYGFRAWIDLRAHTEAWRNRPVNVPGPIRSLGDLLALPDGAVQFVFRHVDDDKLAALIGGEPPAVTGRIAACIPTGRFDHCRRWIAVHGAGTPLGDARRSVIDVANDIHGRFRGFNMPCESRKGLLPRVSAMNREEVLRWGREEFTRHAGTARASERTMAELVAFLKGCYAICQFPLAVEAVALEFADERLLQLGLLAAADGTDWDRFRAEMDAERLADGEHFDRRLDAAIASDCGFTARAELRERLEAVPGDRGPFRTVADVATLADGGLQLVLGFVKGSRMAGLLSMESGRYRDRFANSLPMWWRNPMTKWLDEMPGADPDEATRDTVGVANALHALGLLARPGEAATGDLAPLTLKTHAEVAGWARAEFARIAGDKPASRRNVEELGAMFRGFAAISLFRLAAEAVAAEFADEALVREAATVYAETRPAPRVRDEMEVKARSLMARHRRRLNLIYEGCAALLHGEPEDMLVARCEAFL